MFKFNEINDEKSEIEKNELIRLMNTATDETRKAIIRESLNILDSPRKKIPGQKKIGTQGILNQHANVFETEKIHGNFTKSSPIRPLSAKLRRAYSTTSIQTEVISNDNESKEAQDDINSFTRSNIEATTSVTYSSHNCIQYEDISDLSIIGFDPNRMRNWNPFSIKSNHIKWISTGMFPQLLIINLKHCWYISEITIIAHEVQEILLSIEGSICKMPFTQKENSLFIFPGNSTISPTSQQNMSTSEKTQTSSSRTSKVFGDRILLSFEKCSVDFFTVERIRIEAVPS